MALDRVRRKLWAPIFLLMVLVLVLVLGAGPAMACRLAILGDSLTAGYGLAQEQGFPARLQVLLSARKPPCTVLDAGVSGDTSAGGASRIDWVLADQPTHLIVELGGNDGLRALPVAQLERNLRRIVETARGKGVAVMLAGMLAPPNLGEAYGQEFAAVYTRLAAEYGLPLYPFFLDGVAGNPGLLLADRIHPNAAGVDEIVRRIIPLVVSWLDQTAR